MTCYIYIYISAYQNNVNPICFSEPGAKERLLQQCSQLKQGRTAKYRTIDGTCNNEVRPEWGQANIAFQRLLPPDYEDGKPTLIAPFAHKMCLIFFQNIVCINNYV